MPLYGSWRNAGITLQNLSTNTKKVGEKATKNSAEKIHKLLVGHIDNQDLNWTPLAESTVRIKGKSTVYVDTSYLRNNIKVRKLQGKNLTYFVGANPWTAHPSGLKMSDLMNMLEYGTSKIPPRPLIRPTYEESKDVVKKNMQTVVGDIRKMVIL